jgi:hypothetical protein
MNNNMSKKRDEPFAMHVEIDFEGTSESDGEIYTVTPSVVFDQLSYVFDKLKHKNVKITFKMQMVPSTTHSTTWKKEG